MLNHRKRETMHKHYIVNEGLGYPHTPRIVTKAWGSEEIICQQPHACKIMRLKPGFQVSLHWHRNKTETFILIEGELIIEGSEQSGGKYIRHLRDKYSSLTLPIMTPHTFYCPDNQKGETVFVEASTSDDPGDSYRIFPSGRRGETTNSW